MSNAVELATAYVALVPSMQGAQGKIAHELGAVNASGIGKGIGTRMGSGIVGSLKSLVGPALAFLGAGMFAGYVKEAGDASDATDKFKATMSFAGMDTSAITKAKDAAKAYADATVYDLPTIQNMTAQLASNGIKDYTGLTEAAGNLNAVAGGNAETFKSVAMVMTQTAGQGKLTTENWNQMADAIPGAAGPLMKALEQAGAYTGNFRDAMTAGQITADEFNAALLKLGTKPVAVEAAKSTATFEGAIGNLEATINSNLMTALDAIKPAATAAIGTLSDWIGTASTKAGELATEGWKVVQLLTTGDFKGPIFGLEEDSSLVNFLFDVRDGAIKVGDAARNVASWVNTDVMPALKGFGGWLADVATEGWKVVRVLATGDFQGPIFGLEEDSSLVDFLFNVRDGAIKFGDAVKNVASWVKTDLIPGLQTFGGWLVENKDTVANVATGITVLLLPAFVRLGVTALISGAQQVAAWVMSSTGAITTGITYLAQSYLIIGRWVAMGAAAIASGAETLAIWTLYKVEAIKGAITYGIQSAYVAAAWVAMSAAAIASGAKTAAVWVGTVVANAVTGAVSFGIQVATVVGGWVAMAVAAGANAIGMAAGWVVGVLVPAAAAGIAFLAGVATVVGGWIAMAAGAVVNAAILAGAWLLAFWPVALIAAIVIGLVALIIMNWETISQTTMAVFGAVGAFLSDTWNNIVNGVSGMIGNVVGFFTGLGGQILGALSGAGQWLFDAGKNIVEGLFNGIKSLAGTIGNFFLSLLPGWIVEPFKIALGIHSPSTVFRGYGRNIGQGVVLGVGDEQAGIDRTMKNLVTVPDTPGAATGPNRGSALRSTAGGYRPEGDHGPAVQVDVHTSPGMSEETVGRVAGETVNYQMRRNRG